MLSGCNDQSAVGAAGQNCSKHLCVDLAVNDHPGTAAQLCARRQVHDDRLAIGAQGFHDQRAHLHQASFMCGLPQSMLYACMARPWHLTCSVHV